MFQPFIMPYAKLNFNLIKINYKNKVIVDKIDYFQIVRGSVGKAFFIFFFWQEIHLLMIVIKEGTALMLMSAGPAICLGYHD